jgi:hypothetical protein
MKLDLPVTGTVSATIRGSGDIQRYEQGQVSAEVAKLDSAFGCQHFNYAVEDALDDLRHLVQWQVRLVGNRPGNFFFGHWKSFPS